MSGAWATLTRSGGSDTSKNIPNEYCLIGCEDKQDCVFFGRIEKVADKFQYPGKQVVIPVQYASGTHFSISRTPSEYKLEDWSRNGTFHNGLLLGKGNLYN